MATYNGEKYVEEQIKSILNQSYRNVRIIIRDDGSTDNTVGIITKLQKEYPDKILIVQDDIKCGSSKSNFMQALQSSTSEYVMFSDQDDIWLEYKVAHTLEAMKKVEKKIGNEKPILVFGSYKPVDACLNDIRDKKKNRQEAAYILNFSNLLVQNYVHGCLMMINRKLADIMGKYDEAILMHDWWAALIASGGGKVVHIDEVMMLYRQHGNNVVGSIDVKSPAYIKRKLKDRNTKNACKQYLKQAVLLNSRCGKYLNPKEREQLEKFIELYNYNKIRRIYWLIKGKYMKSDIVRILGQIIYI